MGVNCGLVNRLTDGHFPSAVKLSLFLRLNDVSDANLILLPTSDGPNTHFDNAPVTLGSGRNPDCQAVYHRRRQPHRCEL